MIRTDASIIALNAADDIEVWSDLGEGLAIALNAEGGAPDWIMLVPAGDPVRGSDGRVFKNPSPQAVVDAFNRDGVAVPIDINHSQFLKAPKGDESPAVGWIGRLELREGAIFGRVDWTTIGLNALRRKVYRYISPALVAPRDTITAIAGAGLVNRPNLKMPALNAAEETSMDKELLKKLGLAETASVNDALAAIDALQTKLNAAATPSLNVYVPRADYDLAVQQRDAAQAALNARNEGDRKAKGEALVEQAVKDGKIAPATKGFYLQLCATEDGLKQVTDFVAQQPSHFVKAELDDKAKGGEGGDVQLNAEQKQVADVLGIPHEVFAKEIAAQKTA